MNLYNIFINIPKHKVLNMLPIPIFAAKIKDTKAKVLSINIFDLKREIFKLSLKLTNSKSLGCGGKFGCKYKAIPIESTDAPIKNIIKFNKNPLKLYCGIITNQKSTKKPKTTDVIREEILINFLFLTIASTIKTQVPTITLEKTIEILNISDNLIIAASENANPK